MIATSNAIIIAIAIAIAVVVAVAAVAMDVVLSIGRRKATGMPGLLCLLSSTHTRTSETPGNA